MSWFKKRDKNTKKIHAYVKGIRKRLWIQSIEDGQGRRLDSFQAIGEEAVKIF